MDRIRGGGFVCTWISLLWVALLVGEGEAQLGFPNPLLFSFRPYNVNGSDNVGFIAEFGGAFAKRHLGLSYGFVNRTGQSATSYGRGTENPPSSGSSIERRTSYEFSAEGEEWKIVLPAGRYRFAVFLGDTVTPVTDQSMQINGQTVFAGRNQAPGESTMIWAGERSTDLSGAVRFRGGAGTKLQLLRIFTVSGCRPLPSAFDGQLVSVLPCDLVKVEVPYSTTNSGSQTISMTDSSGVNTGFTMVLPSSKLSKYYAPENVRVVDGQVFLRASEGTMFGTENSAMNCLGVGLPQPETSLQMETTIQVPQFVGRAMRGCLFIAVDDQTFVTLCIRTLGDSFHVVEGYYEHRDERQNLAEKKVYLPNSRLITLFAQLRPRENTIQLQFKFGDNSVKLLERFQVRGMLFSKDAATQDFHLETATFGGVWASGPNTVEYKVVTFEAFPIEVDTEGTSGVEDFDESWFLGQIRYPTSLVVCSNGLLYVSTALGTVEVLRLDRQARKVLTRRKLTPVGPRLILGVECDPNAPPENMALWLSHTDLRQEKAHANSGIISKVSGRSLEQRRDVVKGLPRSYANHANYQIHFGPDGKLYCGVGSNTAAGAASFLDNDFAKRPEQCLSAAILQMDVNNPSFRGDCTPRQSPEDLDESGIAERCDLSSCDVKVFATGTRSPYDFAFVNGSMFVTDNGVGDEGLFPDVSFPYTQGDSCDGRVPASRERATSLGRRDDVLLKVEQGRYYGHPNPSRLECISGGGNPTDGRDHPVPRSVSYGGGTFYTEVTRYPAGTPPQPNYRNPIFSFGTSVSPNGIMQYKGQNFCGALTGDLLVTYYGQLDRVQVLELSAGQDRVVAERPLRKSTLATGGSQMRNPLALTQDRSGLIFVAEFLGRGVRVFDPKGPGCWQKQDMPSLAPVLFTKSSYVQLSDNLYVFGGASPSGPMGRLLRYNVIRNEWKTLKAPAVAPLKKGTMMTVKGRLYMVGGETVSGTPMRSFVSYNLTTGGTYDHVEAPFPVAVSGAVGVRTGLGKLIVIGGRTPFARATKAMYAINVLKAKERRAWSRRDLAVARVDAIGISIGTMVYLCGGKGAEGNTLSSCERFDANRGSPLAMQPLPAPRSGGRLIAVGTEKLLLTGGNDASGSPTNTIFEYTIADGTWKQLKSFMPRRKAFHVVARFVSGMHIIGGTALNTAHTNSVEVFHKY